MTAQYDLLTGYRAGPARPGGSFVPLVRIAGTLYPLRTTGPDPLDTWPARQRQQVRDGAYGPHVAAYAQACADAGLPCRLGWRGVVNALGDYAEVTLPTPLEESAFLNFSPGVEMVYDQARDDLHEADRDLGDAYTNWPEDVPLRRRQVAEARAALAPIERAFLPPSCEDGELDLAPAAILE